MARSKGKKDDLDLRPWIETVGVEGVIKAVGIKEIIKAVGIEELLANLTPEQLRELKERAARRG